MATDGSPVSSPSKAAYTYQKIRTDKEMSTSSRCERTVQNPSNPPYVPLRSRGNRLPINRYRRSQSVRVSPTSPVRYAQRVYGATMDTRLKETFHITEVGGILIKWDIPDFCYRCNNAENEAEIYAESPQFQMRNATWSLRIRTFLEDTYFSEFYLFRHGKMDTFHNITYLITLQNENGEISNSRVIVLIGNDQDKLFKKQYVTEETELLSSLQSSEVLKVVCIVLQGEDEAHSYAEKEEGTSILSDHMKDLFIKGENCDFSIRVKGKEFQVHKAILSARSPVLSAMLHHDMAEKKSGSTDIIDSEPEVFERFLLYLYSGRVEKLSWDYVTHLYSLGDKYDLEHLRRVCLSYMKDNICIEGFCDAIHLAVEHYVPDLVKCAENFFLNNTEKILITTEWSSLMKKNHVICNELFLKHVKKSSPA